MPIDRIARRIGCVCVLLALALWTLSLPLQCAGRAALVGGFALIDGAIAGLCLALVTRVRTAKLIYLALTGAGLTLWPIWQSWPVYRGWPIGDPSQIVAWPGAQAIVYSYFDVLRGCLYLLAIPAPFARFGRHGPDPQLNTAPIVLENHNSIEET